jgi:hypothetical protein
MVNLNEVWKIFLGMHLKQIKWMHKSLCVEILIDK